MKKTVLIIIIILQLAILACVADYIISQPKHPDSPSITVIRGTPGPMGPIGKTGLQGEKGDDGIGIQGPAGLSPTDEQIARAVSDYLANNPPAAGADGQPGQDGINGRDIELRTNPVTLNIEWRYVGNDLWTVLTTHCELTNTCDAW